MPAAPIFEFYFEGKRGFGPGEERKEFPDAFAIAALDAWCENEGEEMHVLSIDGTVREACDTSDNHYPLQSLAYFVDLALRGDEYVEKAAEYLQEHQDNIEEAIKEAVGDQYIHLEDEDGDGEAAVNKISSFSVDDVVKSDEDAMVLRCSAMVNLSVSVSYADRNMTMSYSEDKREYVFGHIREGSRLER